MKSFLSLLLLFLLSLTAVQAQPTTASPAATASTARVSAVNRSVRSALNDSLIRSIQGDLLTLRKENELYRTSLDVNANLFGGISTYFAIVAILLSVIVIAIPLVSYFLVYKPNEQLVAKVEGLESEVLSKIEQNFENYFANVRRVKTQKMLALLDDPLKVSEVTNYFLLNSSDNLQEADIMKIIAFLKEAGDAEKMDLGILNAQVINSKSPAAEKYYKAILEADDKKNYEYAIEYLVENDFPTHLHYVEKIIAAADKSHVLLLDFFDYIAERYLGNRLNKKAPEKMALGIQYAKLLFNNDKILKAIDGEPPPSRHADPRLGRRLEINTILSNPFLRETKYYPLYLQEIDEKHTKNRSTE